MENADADSKCFYGILIQMFWHDHAPPHFHALYAEDEALIDIRTLDMIEGHLPKRGDVACQGMGARPSGRIAGGLGAMLAQSNTKQDQPASLEGAYRPRAAWRVVEVNVLPAYRLNVRFSDGLTGIVDMRALVHSTRAGVFAALSNLELFAKADIEHGVVTWPGEIDLAPDAMYAAIKADGQWVLR